MKKLFTALLVLAVMMVIGCSKEDVKPDYNKYNAIITGQVGTLKALTNDQVVKQAMNLMFDREGTSWICTVEKDTIKNQIILPYWYVVDGNGKLLNNFITSRNVVIRHLNEIIAYIPNEIMDKGEVLVTNAYNANKQDSIVFYLQNHYKYIPINDADWRDLRAKGLN